MNYKNEMKIAVVALFATAALAFTPSAYATGSQQQQQPQQNQEQQEHNDKPQQQKPQQKPQQTTITNAPSATAGANATGGTATATGGSATSAATVKDSGNSTITNSGNSSATSAATIKDSGNSSITGSGNSTNSNTVSGSQTNAQTMTYNEAKYDKLDGYYTALTARTYVGVISEAKEAFGIGPKPHFNQQLGFGQWFEEFKPKNDVNREARYYRLHDLKEAPVAFQAEFNRIKEVATEYTKTMTELTSKINTLTTASQTVDMDTGLSVEQIKTIRELYGESFDKFAVSEKKTLTEIQKEADRVAEVKKAQEEKKAQEDKKNKPTEPKKDSKKPAAQGNSGPK